jgi:hypothetical protein
MELNNVAGFKKLTRMEANVFFQFLTVLEKDTNFIFCNGYNKKNVADALKIKVVSVRVAMVGLHKKNFIKKIRNNVYRVNPTVVYEGADDCKTLLLTSNSNWDV